MRLALLVLIACAVHGQELQRLTGRVIDAASGTPVIAATVTLGLSEGSQQIVTDGLGSFTFIDVPPGDYTLNANRSPSSQSGSNSVTVKVESGTAPDAVELAVPSTGLVTGVVTGENAEPLSASIQIIRRHIQNGEANMEPEGAETNDLGEYRFTNLKPGRYLVCAVAHASAYKQRHHLIYQTNCYPGVPNPESAQWIDLQPGSEFHLDIHFTLVNAVRVTGTVRGSGEQMYLSMTTLNHSYPVSVAAGVEWDPKTRTFVVPALPPGDYVIRASEYRDGKEHSSSRVIHTGSENITGMDLDLSAATMLSGSVRFEGEAATDAGAPSVSTGGQRFELYARGNADFSVPVPPPGSYFFSAHAGGYCPKSASLGGRSVLDNRFTISPDSVPGPLDVVFSKDCGKLFVSLESKSDSLIPILVRREADGNGYLPSGAPLSSGNGPYWALYLTPGDYFVFLVPKDPNLEYMDPAWLRDHESSATPVTIQAGEPTMLKLP